MKQTLKTVFAFIGVMATVGAVVLLILMSLENYDVLPESLTAVRRDPIYQTNLAGDSPQIVSQVKVGDDVKPDIYQTWYNPKTKQYTDFIVEVE